MRLLEKLEAKRNAAYAEYTKWTELIATLQNDPDFAKSMHTGAVTKMNGAHALANGNGHAADRAESARKGWTPERRAEYSERLKADNPMKRKRAKLTPKQRKAASDRMKKRLADPAYNEKRLKGLRKALKARAKARREAVQTI